MNPTKPAAQMTRSELARYIDQSVLKPEFTVEEVKRYIQEGIDFGCRTVCINPAYIDIAREMCKDTLTDVCVVCDFPFGASTTESKVSQTDIICRGGGVEELDVVANYGFIKSGMWEEFSHDIWSVVQAAHSYNVAVKVILETDALTEEEVINATKQACDAGADFIKTSTGFFNGAEAKGATPEIIRIMLDAAAGKSKVKGSGCIRTREHFFELIDMGIDRMGIGYRSTPLMLDVSTEQQASGAGASAY